MTDTPTQPDPAGAESKAPDADPDPGRDDPNTIALERRAAALIRVAHPAHRDALTAAARARKLLPDHAEIAAALDALQTVSGKLQSLVSSVGMDLADLRGYHYHNGVVFAAYCPDYPAALALRHACEVLEAMAGYDGAEVLAAAELMAAAVGVEA